MSDKSGKSGTLGHHRSSGGGFQNPWPSFARKEPKGISLLGGIKKEPSKVDLAALILLAGKPDFVLADKCFKETRSSVVVTWLGHCTFLIQTYGATFLTDPILSKPNGVQAPHGLVHGPGTKRLIPPVCSIAELPEIDAILITSSRPDHLDRGTVREIAATLKAPWYVPLRVGETLRACGVDAKLIHEMDWYQTTSVGRDVELVCTPSQFMSGADRTLKSGGAHLWCSWTVIGVRSRFFFAGGTGYRTVSKDNPFPTLEERRKLSRCPAFEEIGEAYGPFSAAFLPIGGYTPRHVMSSVHMDPMDALCAHKDLRARQTIVMNWGTISHGDEDLLEPLRRLERALPDVGLSDSDVIVMMHGKTRVFY